MIGPSGPRRRAAVTLDEIRPELIRISRRGLVTRGLRWVAWPAQRL